MRVSFLCALLSLVGGCVIAKPAPPVLGVISTDQHGGWVLYTANSNVDPHTRIFVLDTGATRQAVCCAVITSRISVPRGREAFFTDVDSDQPPKQLTYSIKVPSSAILMANPVAMAVWNVSSASTSTGSYILHQTQHNSTYKVYSCFSAEGMNMYIDNMTRPSSQLSHYYVYFGYDIGGNECLNQQPAVD